MALRMTLALMLFGLSAVGRAADPVLMPASKPQVRHAVLATIDGQLAAFRKQDYAGAYAYAAAALRVSKPLPVFLAIVQASYPEIWTNRRADYGIVRDDGSSATVLVHVYGRDGDASYDYTLVKEQGRWRVHDVLRHDPAGEEKV